MKIKMAKDDLWNIDLVESWLSYHFPERDDRYVFEKMIYKQVKTALKNYWDCDDFFQRIAGRVIKEMSRRSWHPLCHPQYVDMLITHVFFHNHAAIMMKWIGIDDKVRKKRR